MADRVRVLGPLMPRVVRSAAVPGSTTSLDGTAEDPQHQGPREAQRDHPPSTRPYVLGPEALRLRRR